MQIAAVALLVVFAVSAVVAWRAERRDRSQLQQQLKSAQQALTEVNARQTARDVTLTHQVAQLEKMKVAVGKPADILKALPEVLPLPKPLVLESTPKPLTTAHGSAQDKVNLPDAPRVLLPVEDLKPIYDSAVACKECRLKLTVDQADLADEKTKTVTLSRERDDALRIVKGGSALSRVVRAAKWFAIGAAVGAAAAKLAR